jgi:hypothetical protein
MHKLLGLVKLFVKMIIDGFFGGRGGGCPPIQKEEVKGPKTMNSKNSLPPIKAFCPSPLKQKQYQPSSTVGN